MENMDWKSMPVGEFERDAADAVKAALEALRRTKGGRWELTRCKAESIPGYKRIVCEVSFPIGPSHQLYIHDDTTDDPFSLSLVCDARAELQELRKRVSEREFLIACLATWFYMFAKKYERC